MAERQLDNVQFESVRKVVDDQFLTLVESLEEAYYGTRGRDGKFAKGTGWRDGVSSPWRGFDVQPTQAESKALFDRLHGQIWKRHQIAIAAENERQGQPYPVDKVDPIVDERTVKRRSQLNQEELDATDTKDREASDPVVTEEQIRAR